MFFTDQISSLNGETKHLRAEMARASEQQATLVFSVRDDVKACLAEIAGWKRATGSAASKQAAQPATNPPLRIPLPLTPPGGKSTGIDPKKNKNKK